MKQGQQIKKIKEMVCRADKNARVIKISGSSFQEAGLPDLMILSTKFGNWWVELKCGKDKPTTLQEWNIDDLRKYHNTGYIVDDLRFRYDWNDLEEYDFETIFKTRKERRHGSILSSWER